MPKKSSPRMLDERLVKIFPLMEKNHSDLEQLLKTQKNIVKSYRTLLEEMDNLGGSLAILGTPLSSILEGINGAHNHLSNASFNNKNAANSNGHERKNSSSNENDDGSLYEQLDLLGKTSDIERHALIQVVQTQEELGDEFVDLLNYAKAILHAIQNISYKQSEIEELADQLALRQSTVIQLETRRGGSSDDPLVSMERETISKLESGLERDMQDISSLVDNLIMEIGALRMWQGVKWKWLITDRIVSVMNEYHEIGLDAWKKLVPPSDSKEAFVISASSSAIGNINNSNINHVHDNKEDDGDDLEEEENIRFKTD